MGNLKTEIAPYWLNTVVKLRDIHIGIFSHKFCMYSTKNILMEVMPISNQFWQFWNELSLKKKVLFVLFSFLEIYSWWEYITDRFWDGCLIYYGDNLLREDKIFSEKIVQTLLDQIESDGKNVMFFYLYEYLFKEVMSEDFKSSWVWQKELFLICFCLKGNHEYELVS